MDSTKLEPEEISWITDSNLLELNGYVKEEPEVLNVLELQLLEEADQKDGSVDNLPFSCEYCGARFNQKSHLGMHQNKRTGVKYHIKYKCRVGDCTGRTFICKQEKEDHVEIYHPPNQPQILKCCWKCSECSFTAKNLNGLKHHSSIHKPKYPCDQCSRSFVTWTLLSSHKAIHNKHACSKCGFQFGTRKDFREHQSQMGIFKCLLCEKEFECEHARSQHLERDHEKEISHKVQHATLQHKEQSELDVEMKFECDHCGLSVDKKRKLFFHMIDHFKFSFSCDDCGARFSWLRNLTKHRKNYSGIFNCVRKNCTKVFKCKHALTAHRKDHEKIWKCPECLEIFKAKGKLQNHRNKQHNIKLECDLCELSFLKERGLQFHKWKCHNFSCAKCEKKFNTLNDLKKHEILTHTNQQTKNKQISVDSNESIVPKQEQKYSSTVKENGNDPAKENRLACRKCGKKFAYREGLKRHESLWSKFTCKICDQEFQCRFGLVQHIQQYHENEFKCLKCPFVGKDLSALRSHCYGRHKAQAFALQPSIEMSDTHKKYACSKCGLEFGTRKDFRGHQSQMGIFKCLLCVKEFECEHAKSQHLERYHEKEISQLAALQKKESSKLDVEKKFECDHCGLSFDKRQKLLYHMNLHVKFVSSCEECGFRSRDLTWHRKNYSGNFKCYRKNCNKVFKCKRGLKIHARDEHERNWKCPERPKILKSRKSFKSHVTKYHEIAEPLWISKNQKPENQCDQCQLSFASKALLKFHMFKHQQQDAAMEALVFSCKKCGAEFESQNDLSLHQTTADEYDCALLNEKYNFIYSTATSNQPEKSSDIDQRLETVIKLEQEESSSEIDSESETLGMNIYVKKEPEVSYMLKLPSE